MENVWKTYKFFNEKGRRMSIFAKPESGGIEITVIPCSRHDQFCKAKARELYQEGKCHMEIFHADGNCFADFIKWCNNKYNKLITTFVKVESCKRVQIVPTGIVVTSLSINI